MLEPIQTIIIIFALFAMSRAYFRLKESKITKTEFTLWVSVWTSVIIVAFIPQVIITLSEFFGLGRGLDLAILTSIILLLYLIFRAYVKIEMLEQELTIMTRKLAIEKAQENSQKNKTLQTTKQSHK